MDLTIDDIRVALDRDLGIDTAGIDGSTPLFSGGVLNSFTLVALMTLLEKRAGVKIRPMDLTLDNFDSIDRILAYLARSRVSGVARTS